MSLHLLTEYLHVRHLYSQLPYVVVKVAQSSYNPDSPLYSVHVNLMCLSQRPCNRWVGGIMLLCCPSVCAHACTGGGIFLTAGLRLTSAFS